MTDEIRIGDRPVFTEVPEDATPGEAVYMRAQTVIRAAFFAFGDRETRPGTSTLSGAERLRCSRRPSRCW